MYYGYMKEVECIISGKVQGVFFRNYIKDKAHELGLVGFVQNMPEGSVEVLIQGEEEDIETLLEHIKKGPVFSNIRNIDITWADALQDTFTDFTIEQ